MFIALNMGKIIVRFVMAPMASAISGQAALRVLHAYEIYPEKYLARFLMAPPDYVYWALLAVLSCTIWAAADFVFYRRPRPSVGGNQGDDVERALLGNVRELAKKVVRQAHSPPSMSGALEILDVVKDIHPEMVGRPVLRELATPLFDVLWPVCGEICDHQKRIAERAGRRVSEREANLDGEAVMRIHGGWQQALIESHRVLEKTVHIPLKT